MDKHTCCQKIYPNDKWGSFNPHTCGRSASYEYEGKWYCGTHDPNKAAVREEKLQAARQERAKAKQALIDDYMEKAWLSAALPDSHKPAFIAGWRECLKRSHMFR